MSGTKRLRERSFLIIESDVNVMKAGQRRASVAAIELDRLREARESIKGWDE